MTTVDSPEPFQVAYEAIVTLPATTGVSKVKRADMHAAAAVRALAKAGLFSNEDTLRVLMTWHDYDRHKTCPGCGVLIERTALVDVAYTFEPCDCDAAPYVHLVQQMWHREHVGAHLTVEATR